jgi:hypothetical protein
MNFSLSKEIHSSSLSTILSDEFDLYAFFVLHKSIDLSDLQNEIISSMLGSLRQKKGILILDKTLSPSEKFDFNRGVRTYVGSGFIYLAPQSLSLLRTQIREEILTFQDVNRILIQSNLLK